MVIRKAIKRNADPEKMDMKSSRETLDTHVRPSLLEEMFLFFVFFSFGFKANAKKVRAELIVIL